jgi:hypothetical protein
MCILIPNKGLNRFSALSVMPASSLEVKCAGDSVVEQKYRIGVIKLNIQK